jgi:hypothetical protein
MVSHVAAGCDDGLGDVSDSMIKAAGKAGNAWTAAEAKRMRREMQVYCNQPGNQRTKEGKSTVTAAEACQDTRKEVVTAIAKLKGMYELPATMSDAAAKDKICGAAGKAKTAMKEVCGEEDIPTTTGQTGGKKITDCSEGVKDNILAAYKPFSGVAGNAGVVVDTENPLPTQSTGDVGSFCNAGNNSGPFNTKGNILQGGNPMAGQSGAGGIQY